ncbi:MAG: insulinase family protein [Planctomycetes bacterium]|nr:insulinase family protein [Planctomycetota bacterium]
MKHRLLAAACAMLAVSAGPARGGSAGPGTPASPDGPAVVQRTVTDDGTLVAKLDNGLAVIIKTTRTAPVVCVRALVRAGGLYEGEYLGCGISHLCEHLVAKGALTNDVGGSPGGETAQVRPAMEDIGGQSNASTSLAWTQYYISAAAGKVMDCIDVLADWMCRCEIRPEDFRREHGVVMRELELGRDDPDRQLWHAHAADVYRNHPAAVPVIGYLEPLRQLTLDDVLAYHRRMYTPGNMVFVVVGDVDAGKVLERVRRAFAGCPAGRVADLSLPPVSPLPGVVRTTRPHAGLKETMEEMSFQTISLLDADLYSLDVLAAVLGDGETSRLARTVRRRMQLVTAVSCSSWTPHWGKGILNVSFRCDPNKVERAERAVLGVLREATERTVSPAELARAKRQIIADFVYGQQSVESISTRLGTDYIATGDASFSRHYIDGIRAVTAGQVLAAARKYITPDRMVITRLVPAERFRAAAKAREAAAARKVVTFRLPNGLKVVLNSTDSVRLVSMALVTRGGLLAETPSTNGLGALMTALTTKGTPGRSAEQIAEFFARAGGGISAACGNNAFYWRASVLDDGFDEALAIFADVICRPTMPAKELELLKPLRLAAVDRVKENWLPEIQEFFRAKFFTGSPYSMLPVGRKDVIRSATARRLEALRRKYIRAGDSVLAIYGHFDAQAARRRIEKLFADMPAGRAEFRIPPARSVAPDGELYVFKTDKQVAGVIVAAPTITATDLPDRFALDVLDTIISGYRLPAGWLHNELRGKRLVYVVHAFDWIGLAPGAFVVYAAGQPDKAPEVVRIIHKNLRRAATYTPSRREIARAVRTILTAELLDNQAMSDLAFSAALDELYGFGWDFHGRLEEYYNKVTPADIARAAKKYLSGGYVTVVATPRPELFRAPGGERPAGKAAKSPTGEAAGGRTGRRNTRK